MALEQAGLEWINKGLPGFVSDINKADDAMGDAGRESESAGGKFTALGSIITGVATGMTTFALDAVVGLGKALVGLGKGSIDVATEFESSMAVLGIAASSTGLGMEDLSEAALAVGGDTRLLGVSASGAAESMTGLFKAGLTSQEVFGDLQGYMEGTADLGGTLRASIDLAAATTLDMVTASDVAAVTLATFGSEAEKAGISTDVWIVDAMNNLVMAADASVAEVGPMVEALKMVGPQASAMSISLADVNNALAIMSTRGKQGTMAGTGLNRMLLDLVKGTPKATEMMEALGIAVYDNEGTMLPLVDIIGQFEIALEGATDAERDAALAAIFTTQGAATMNTMLEEGVQGWTDMADATANAATMQEQGAAMAETYAAKQEALEGVIETLQIKIGSALLPILSDLTGAFSEFIDEYGPVLIGVFENVAGVIKDVLPQAIEGLMSLFRGDFAGVIENFEPIISRVFGRGAAGVFLDLVRIVTGVVDKIKKAFLAFQEGGLGGLAEALGIDPQVIETVTGVIDGITDALDRIRQWFDDNRPALEAAFGTIQKVFQDTVGAVVEAFKEAWPDLQAAFEDIKEAFAMLGIESEGSGKTIENIAKVISAVIIGVGTIVSGVFRAVTAVVSFFAEHFKDSLETAINIASGFKDWIQGIMDVVSGIFTGDWEKVKKGFLKSWEGMAKTIVNVVKMIVKGITMPFRAVYKMLKGFVKGVIKFFKDLAKKLVGGSIIPDMMDEMLGVIEDVLDAILDFWRGIFEDILETTEKIFDDIEETVDTIMASIEDIIETISESIQDIWESFTELLQEVWEDVWDAIEEFVDDTFNAIEDLIDGISESISDLWESFTDLLQEVWEEAWDAIEELVDTVFTAIEGLIDGISDNIEEAWETFTENVEEVWETAWGSIEDLVDEVYGAIETFIDTVSGRIEDAWETFTGNVEEVWDTAWGNISDLLDEVYAAIESAISTISGRIEDAWETFTEAVETFWGDMWDAIDDFISAGGAFETIETAIDTIATRIQGAWETFTAAVSTFWSDMWDAIEAFILEGGLFTAIRDAISTISTSIQTAWSTFTAALQTAWDTIWGAIQTTVTTILGTEITGIWGLINSITSSIQTTWETFTGALSTAWSTVFNALAGIVQTAFDAAGSGVRAILAAAVAALTTIFDLDLVATVTSIGNSIIQYIVSGITAFSNAVGGFVANVTSTLSGWFSDLMILTAGWVSSAWDFGSYIVGRILAGVRTFSNIIGDFADNVSNWLRSTLLDIAESTAAWVTNARAIGSAILDRIMEGVEAVQQWASDFWTWLWDQIWDGISGDSGAQDVGNAAGTMLMDGIADGIRNDAYIVQSALNSVISGLSVPSITIPIHEETISGGTSYATAPVSPAPVLPTASQTLSTSITIGPNTITDIMDMAEFEARVVQAVTTAI